MKIKDMNALAANTAMAIVAREKLGQFALEYVSALEPVVTDPNFGEVDEVERNFYTEELAAIKQLLSRPVPE